MLFSIGKHFFLEVQEGDKGIEQIFAKKFTVCSDTSIQPDIIITPRKMITLSKEKVLGEVVIKRFCVSDGERLAFFKRNKKLIIPFMDVGKDIPLKIECEVGFPPDWLRFIFDQIFAFHILKKGFSLFHATGVELRGEAILFPGWRATGKTTLTLALLTRIDEKVRYIGEDFVLVSQGGGAELYSDALHLDHIHLSRFKELRDPFSYSAKARLLLKGILTRFIPPKSEMLEYLNRGVVHVLCPGAKYFTKLSTVLPEADIVDNSVSIGKNFLLIAKDDLTGISCHPMGTDDLITKMLAGMTYERKEFFELYNAFTFATGLRNKLIDDSQAVESGILERAFSNSECFELEISRQQNIDQQLKELVPILTSK